MTAAHDLTTTHTAELRLSQPLTAADVVNVPYALTRGCRFQPRKRFEHGPLVELAASIYQRTTFDAEGRVVRSGIEQNLIGRPDAQNAGGYEIAAGERRQRAVGLLVQGLSVAVKVSEDANGRPIMGEVFYQVPADYPLPFRVQDMTDADMIETATLENVLRQDMTPMEEADAFMALLGAGRTLDCIATKYRMHPATVEGRIQLACGLGKEGRKLLDKGEINLEQAKVIASATGALKKSLTDHARSGSSTATLKNLVRICSFPVSNAVFDVEASGLQVEDTGGLGLLGDFPARFKDPKAALNKQLEALEAVKTEEEAAGKWGGVEVLSVESEYANLPTHDFVSCPDEMTPHLTLICSTRTGKTARSELYVHRHLALAFKRQMVEEARRPAEAQAQASGAAPHSQGRASLPQTGRSAGSQTPAAPKVREAAHVIAHRARAQTIQGKLATDTQTCLALSCHALLENHPKLMEISKQSMKAVPLTGEGRALAAELNLLFGTIFNLDEQGYLGKKNGEFDVLSELLHPQVTADALDIGRVL